ncbi:phosphoenolpyruvate carboxykinase (ATP) [Marinitoga piezophila KA3]|uniref:phosphoenolpyruvate carboxykinase (ATP) n=1 Tax=Marinitoga piezophila (strain DSM 14283 / JCM 11233 / KA3) TaxID=443254 RepID=H2J3D5_MARPK|nr:phosphoenolpyruvate carboxykinase (ATP) [Marinitoga piezophila]AEX85751.1 phosphoenolpyruvate carboxykinase (ATP) [Marinitoga piezophila KA3]
MATKNYFSPEEINPQNPVFSRIRTTIETAFFRNNVVKVDSPKEAYKLAKNSPGTIITDLNVYKPELLALDEGAKILIFNDGAVTGRYAAGRRIVGEPDVDVEKYAEIIREAVYNTRFRKMYHAISFTGLHEDFIIKNHLLIPEGHENILYNWLLNLQPFTVEFIKIYENSVVLNEGDVYIFSDPDWKHPDFPLGLSFFDPEHNCAAILGMRYFGEFKKGTLTLGWGIANRNGYASCHGGLKKYTLKDNESYVAAFFGLSGSGKSTLTHAKHNGKYDITILHDDAFVISMADGSSISLEPSYFDKTADYPVSSEDNKYLLTIQNCGATIDNQGRVIPVMEDIRNGNGRALKSKLWSPNRVYKIDDPINAIFWLMKDPVLPPILKVTDPVLASTLGATLATKRTSAEKLAEGVDPDALVFEPYANPFRTYPLSDDYYSFKKLFEKGVDCYILNTGHFLDKKITKEVTLSIIENIVDGKAEFKEWANGIEIMEIEGYTPDMTDKEYVENFISSMQRRIDFINSRETEKGGRDKLPSECKESIEDIINQCRRNKKDILEG